jgi:ferredoxin
MADELPYEIVTDRETCMGSGVCCVYAPNTFTTDDEAKVVVTDPAGDALDRIRSAVQGCPTGAIRLVER